MGAGDECPVAGRSRSLARGEKVLLGMCAGTLLAEEGVRAPSTGLSLKAGVACPAIAKLPWGRARLRERELPSHHPPAFLSGVLLPGLGHSQHPVPPPLAGEAGRRLLAGAVPGGRFSQSKEWSGTDLAPASSDIDTAGWVASLPS